MYTTASLVDRAGQRYDVATVGTIYGARFETVTYVTTDFRSDVYAAGQRALGDFMRSLRFGSGGGPTHDAAGFVTNATLPRATGKFDACIEPWGRRTCYR